MRGQGHGTLAAATLALVAVGAMARAVQYSGERSLWLDEALLVPAVHRSWLELLDPRTVGPTPPGFLWATKALVTLLGDGESVLRALPFLGSLGALVALAALARRLLPPAGAVAAVAFAALSPFLVYYAGEFKPYSTDVLAGTLVLWAVVKARRTRLWAQRPRAHVGAALGALALVVCSFPAFLVLLGGVGALAWDARRRGDTVLARRLRPWAWATGVALCLGLVVRAELRDGNALMDYWRDGFWPLPPRSWAEVLWPLKAFLWLVREPFGLLVHKGSLVPHALALLVVIGAVTLARRRPFTAALLLGPLAAAWLAAALRLYPLAGDWKWAGRVGLYLAPSIYLLAGAGVAGALGGRPRSAGRTAVALALSAAVVLPMAAELVRILPYARADWRAALTRVAAARRPGDVVFVHYDAAPLVRYYAPRLGLRPEEIVWGSCARTRPDTYLRRFRALAARGGRVWVLMGEEPGVGGFPEQALVRAYLEARGTVLARLDGRQVHVRLVDLHRPRRTFVLPALALTARPGEGCTLWQPQRT